MNFPFQLTEKQWRDKLTPQQYYVMREHGTEAAGSCALLNELREGAFYCAGCDNKLFESDLKFESGTGWPSFTKPVPGSVGTSRDSRHGMIRTEVHCSNCGSHLGHVFNDSPAPNHQRFCINGIALSFRAKTPNDF